MIWCVPEERSYYLYNLFLLWDCSTWEKLDMERSKTFRNVPEDLQLIVLGRFVNYNEIEPSETLRNVLERSELYQERSKLALFTYKNTNFKGTFQSNPECSGTYQNVLFHCFSLERSKLFVFKIACDDIFDRKNKIVLKMCQFLWHLIVRKVVMFKVWKFKGVKISFMLKLNKS